MTNEKVELKLMKERDVPTSVEIIGLDIDSKSWDRDRVWRIDATVKSGDVHSHYYSDMLMAEKAATEHRIDPVCSTLRKKILTGK